MSVPVYPVGAAVARWPVVASWGAHQEIASACMRAFGAEHAARVTSSINPVVADFAPTAAAAQLSVAGVERTGIGSLSRCALDVYRETARRHAVLVGLEVAGASGA
jgi:hypothetical protein